MRPYIEIPGEPTSRDFGAFAGRETSLAPFGRLRATTSSGHLAFLRVGDLGESRCREKDGEV